MNLIALRRLGMLLIVIAALATACEPPTPVVFITPTIQATASATFLPAATVQPTDTPAPTRTPVPPTATSIPPTATATSTPTNTATTIPTRAASVTPRATPAAKPTATKVATTDVGPVVSTKPTTLEKSVQQSLNAVYAAIGLLDQMKQGGGVELCAPLLTGYQSIHNAPTYDPNGQSVQFQQAYNLYRQAIDLINSRAASFQSCGQSGGTIGGLDWSDTRAKLDRAAQLLQQALDWAQRTADPSSMSLSEAVTRARLAAVAIVGAMDRYLDAGSHEPCEPIVAEINALKAMPTYEVSSRPAAVQNAYTLYRQAVDLGVAKTVSIVDVCAQGGGQIGSLDAYALRQAFRDIYSNLSQALKLLGQ